MPNVTFRKPEQAFADAIASGHLSTDQKSAFFAGNFMYMHTTEQGDAFKHIDSRKYMTVAKEQPNRMAHACLAITVFVIASFPKLAAAHGAAYPHIEPHEHVSAGADAWLGFAWILLINLAVFSFFAVSKYLERREDRKHGRY